MSGPLVTGRAINTTSGTTTPHSTSTRQTTADAGHVRRRNTGLRDPGPPYSPEGDADVESECGPIQSSNVRASVHAGTDHAKEDWKRGVEDRGPAQHSPRSTREDRQRSSSASWTHIHSSTEQADWNLGHGLMDGLTKAHVILAEGIGQRIKTLEQRATAAANSDVMIIGALNELSNQVGRLYGILSNDKTARQRDYLQRWKPDGGFPTGMNVWRLAVGVVNYAGQEAQASQNRYQDRWGEPSYAEPYRLDSRETAEHQRAYCQLVAQVMTELIVERELLNVRNKDEMKYLKAFKRAIIYNLLTERITPMQVLEFTVLLMYQSTCTHTDEVPTMKSLMDKEQEPITAEVLASLILVSFLPRDFLFPVGEQYSRARDTWVSGILKNHLHHLDRASRSSLQMSLMMWVKRSCHCGNHQATALWSQPRETSNAFISWRTFREIYVSTGSFGPPLAAVMRRKYVQTLHMQIWARVFNYDTNPDWTIMEEEQEAQRRCGPGIYTLLHLNHEEMEVLDGKINRLQLRESERKKKRTEFLEAAGQLKRLLCPCEFHSTSYSRIDASNQLQEMGIRGIRFNLLEGTYDNRAVPMSDAETYQDDEDDDEEWKANNARDIRKAFRTLQLRAMRKKNEDLDQDTEIRRLAEESGQIDDLDLLVQMKGKDAKVLAAKASSVVEVQPDKARERSTGRSSTQSAGPSKGKYMVDQYDSMPELEGDDEEERRQARRRQRKSDRTIQDDWDDVSSDEDKDNRQVKPTAGK